MFEQGRAALDPTATLKYSLCPNGENVMYRDRPMHVAAWAKQFLFQPEQLNSLISNLSGGEQAARSDCSTHVATRRLVASR